MGPMPDGGSGDLTRGLSSSPLNRTTWLASEEDLFQRTYPGYEGNATRSHLCEEHGYPVSIPKHYPKIRLFVNETCPSRYSQNPVAHLGAKG